MTTIFIPLERGRAGKSFKKKFFFQKIHSKVFKSVFKLSRYANKILVIWTKEQKSREIPYNGVDKVFEKKKSLNDFPARPLFSGVTIVVIAVLEGKL